MTVTNEIKLRRLAILYRDLLSNNFHPLSETAKAKVLSLKPKNKMVAIGNIESQNWNAYPLTYLLHNKLVAPTVLDDSKIYQSMHAMRVHDESIIHPQALISQSVVIHLIGLDNSAGINDYLNTFIGMCIASDDCKIIFVVVEGDKKRYTDNIYIRKTNSTFIDTSNGTPYKLESTALCLKPESIVFFSKKTKAPSQQMTSDVLSDNPVVCKKPVGELTKALLYESSF